MGGVLSEAAKYSIYASEVCHTFSLLALGILSVATPLFFFIQLNILYITIII